MKRKILNLLSSFCFLAIIISLFIPNFALYSFSSNMPTPGKTPSYIFNNVDALSSMYSSVNLQLSTTIIYIVSVLQLALSVLAILYFILSLLDFSSIRYTYSNLLKRIFAIISLILSITILILCLYLTLSNIVVFEHSNPSFGTVKYILIGLCAFFSLTSLLGSIFALITNSKPRLAKKFKFKK